MASVVLRVKAPITHVWRVVGERWGDVYRIIPSLSSSHLITKGPLRPGSRRSCTLVEPIMGVETIEEQLSAWEDGKSFSYVYHDAPWPIESVSNQWTLEADGDETRLTLTPSLKMRGGAWTQWLAPAMLWLMSRSLKDDVPQMVAAIERECAEFSQSSRGRPDRA